MLELLNLPPDWSVHGHRVDQIIVMVHYLMFALLIGWGGFFIYCLVRFRAKKQPKADYQGVKTHLSSYLEVTVAVIEAAILIGFAYPVWADWVDIPVDETNAVKIRVVAEQFAWNIHYPGPDGIFGRTDLSLVNTADNPLGLDREDPAGKDDITTLNQLKFPINRPIVITITSKDVIHSFFLPYFRVKQDAIPGIAIPVHFTGTTEGKSEIACAQLCGLGHYRMRGFVTAMSQVDYDKWVADEEQALIDAGSYEEW